MDYRKMVEGWVNDWIEADRNRSDLPESFAAVLTSIDNHFFKGEVEVEDLLKGTGVSRNAGQAFQRLLGFSPIKYLGRLRVEAGKRLLQSTELQVGEISDLLSYKNASTFSSAFSAAFGISPKHYQDNWQARKDHLVDSTGRVQEPACKEAQSLTTEGRVDEAYKILLLASTCNELSQVALLDERFAIPLNPQEALLSELCVDCREKLLSETGWMVRNCLENALLEVPRYLPWFLECCNKCYERIWNVLELARLGLLQNAWKACWLFKYADLKDRKLPPSLGRFIIALSKVKELRSGDQVLRKQYSELAITDSNHLGNPLLQAEAGTWDATVLRGLGQFNASRAKFLATKSMSTRSSWLTALHCDEMGLLEFETGNLDHALRKYRVAQEIYTVLDPHRKGVVMVSEGIVSIEKEEFIDALRVFDRAIELVDEKRDTGVVGWSIPINRAIALALLGKLAAAERAIDGCKYDKRGHEGDEAVEEATRGRIRLLAGRYKESLVFFLRARQIFERLSQPLSVGEVACHCVEAYSHLRDWHRAKENITMARLCFEQARCNSDILTLADSVLSAIEAGEHELIRATARVLSREIGAWLPALDS